MADIFVTATQNWLNATYGTRTGWVPVVVDGETGNATVAALTRALQLELGITALSSSFGPGTLAALTTFGNISATTQSTKPNIVKIVQGAMYCKGYDSQGYIAGGGLNGVYANTVPAAKQLRTDMGVGAGDGSIAPKVFKALLTTEAAILIPGGKPVVRQIQQDLNGRYINRRDFYLMPTDGVYSRNVQTALLFALQYELGIADGVANGNFGLTTQGNLRSQGSLSQGSADGSKYLVHLLQAALNFNGYPVAYDGVFGATTANIVASFQLFAALSVTRGANFETWASLLVSTGDPIRPAGAADCVTTITPARAATLIANGHRTVGRYLTNTPDNVPNKNIKQGELATIFAAGLTVFPIFQTGGATPSHFTTAKGLQVANEGYAAARAYGFKRGAIIYYTVDWDALDVDIDTKVLPYFKRLNERFEELGSFYRIGVYGPRNICSRVSAAGYAVSSFVSGMSTGYSGNLGFRLPSNWAFDQIATVTIGSGTGAIEIDRNTKSGRYDGESSVQVRTYVPDVATPEYEVPSLRDRIVDWLGEKMEPQQIAGAVRSRGLAAQIILDHDATFTSVADGLGMRKALIQTATMWEAALENVVDTGKDAQVRLSFAYLRAKAAWDANPVGNEPVPVPLDIDGSTGASQIFPSTAIPAINWARSKGFTTEPERHMDNWMEVEELWTKLNEDIDFNIKIAAYVLLYKASLAGLSDDYYTYGRAEVEAILTGYNGEVSYGTRNYGLYLLFEQVNSTARNI